MDLAGFQNGVYARLGVSTSDPQFPSSAVTEFVNAALRQIAAAHSWPWLEASEDIATTAGDATYTPSAVAGSVWTSTEAIVVTISGVVYVLTRYDDRTLLDEHYDATTRGQPDAFCIHADEIVLRPVPDTVYTLTHRYQKAEKVLGSSSESPYLPDAYASAVSDLATVLALSRSKQDPRAVGALARYTTWLDDMAENRRRGRKPTRIRVRAGGYI